MSATGLKLRLAHSTLTIDHQGIVLFEQWEVYHPALDVVLDTFGQSRRAVPATVEACSQSIYAEAEQWFGLIEQWHEPLSVIDDYSLFDARHILEDWTFTPNGQNFDLEHPVSGTFPDQVVPVVGRPTVVGRIQAILAIVPGPTAWARADSPSSGVLRVTCQSVSGADSYNVYSDDVLLGNVPDEGLNTISVSVGTYNVRIAAVKADVIGIQGNAVSVTVA